MDSQKDNKQILSCLEKVKSSTFSPLNLLSSRTDAEKMIELTLLGVPEGNPHVTEALQDLFSILSATDSKDLNVVVFGGGTGLSTIIGGDSRNSGWKNEPFLGLKTVFPKTKSIVCATDDGGSTGELLKDLPIIGLGDIRHVMLSSVQKDVLKEKYALSESEVYAVAAELHAIFNHRFKNCPSHLDELFSNGDINLDILPAKLSKKILKLLKILFTDKRLSVTLSRPHCLGNLIITSAIYSFNDPDKLEVSPEALRDGLCLVSDLIGVGEGAVLPCTTTPSMLRVRYANGVSVTGESKSSKARRGFPVDRVFVDFSSPTPFILPEVKQQIIDADIIIFAPGSLYTSIVPIMQVPGLSDLVRENRSALKILVANLWVQLGETDISIEDPDRRFYVSDLITAYHRNIPGGIDGLFQQIMLLGMHDIPGSILQRYAVEGKNPIYLDRKKVWQMGFSPIEANIFSKKSLQERRVRHDQDSFAKAIKTLWSVRNKPESITKSRVSLSPVQDVDRPPVISEVPYYRYSRILKVLKERGIDKNGMVAEVLWRHFDIPLEHLLFINGIKLVEPEDWGRCQEWDSVFSFYDPEDKFIKIRNDMLENNRFEVAFLVALGQSILGDYALKKDIAVLEVEGEKLGKIYHLHVKPSSERMCFFNDDDLSLYLSLSRMHQCAKDKGHFTRVLNANEGFTPPGLLFGLVYAWYLDNRFASHIEYKMDIARHAGANLVPEQIKTKERRRGLIDFFRTKVFKTFDNNL